LIKPQVQKLTINYLRKLIKTAETLTFASLYVKAVKELKMPQNRQEPTASYNLPYAEIKQCLDSVSGNAAGGKS
jgi:hypothetical protein